MYVFLFFLIPGLSLAFSDSPAPFPIFLKEGYSSVLEFDKNPSQVVIGDTGAFQVERLKNSVVIRPLVSEASTNMFVYFRSQSPKLFLLTASDEAEPSLYRKFESSKPVVKKPKPVAQARYRRATRLIHAQFDKSKDYLSVEIAMTADSTDSIAPDWEAIRLRHKNKDIVPSNIWSERQVVQKDSRVKARFTFKRPNVPRDLNGTTLLIPLKGHKDSVILTLSKGR